jgi:excisionase family DNA binding protein
MREKAKPSSVKPEFISRQDAATWLSVNVQTIDKLLRQSKLTAYRVGRCVRLRHAEVLAYVEGRRTQ